MALIKCKNCGQMVSDSAENCTNCGNPINNQDIQVSNQSKFHFGWFLFFSLIVPSIVSLIVFILWKNKRPQYAYSALYGAIVNLILSIIFVLLS